MKLFEHQADALKATENQNKVAYYHDMGLGKTFTGAEKMMRLGGMVNLVICQKSKIDDWVKHFYKNYPSNIGLYDLTEKDSIACFVDWSKSHTVVGVINYDLIFRRPELLKIHFNTIMLDESSIIQNRTSKRSNAILKIEADNVILLSGTPTGGKYEKLWSQVSLLGWNITERTYMNQYVKYHWDDNEGFPIRIIDGYKNVKRLKRKLREHGCHFLKTDEVFDLPEQIHTDVQVKTTKDYKTFRKKRIVTVDGVELVGDTLLTKMLYERQLCGQYNPDKLKIFRDLLESTNDRVIVFYNFNDELRKIEDVCIKLDRPLAIVNGVTKDLSLYEEYSDSVTAIQYQAGAMGLNLQKANRIIYFTPPLSSELFEQSKKRIHRIGQERRCFYYYLKCSGSIEEKIYKTLAMRRDYTDALFEESEV